jgi:hypothetical protein
MREEAVRVAQQVTGKNQEYEAIISRGEAALVGQIQERAKLALEQARNSYRNAYEEGDTDRLLKPKKG